MAVSSYDKEKLSKEDQDKIAGVTDKAQKGEMSWADAHSQAESIRGGAGYSGGADGAGNFIPGDTTGGFGDTRHSSGGSGGGGRQQGGSDYSDYLKDLYASNTAAQLAALKDAYEQNTADLDANGKKISKTYYAARNETAAQSELQRQRFNEYAAARGLNTGAGGQAELARSTALQGNLAGIAGQEADAVSENDLAREKLASQYRNAVTQAEAGGNSQLAQALYQEYVRQDSMARQAEALDREQANWEKQFGFAQQQYQDSRTGSRRDQAYNLAMTMLGIGIMPDTATLTAAGISSTDAQAMRLAVERQKTAPAMSAAPGRQKTAPAKPAPINSPRTTDIAAAASQYRREHPNIYLDSRTLDYWLAENGYSGENAQRFKAYLEEYGAEYQRR